MAECHDYDLADSQFRILQKNLPLTALRRQTPKDHFPSLSIALCSYFRSRVITITHRPRIILFTIVPPLTTYKLCLVLVVVVVVVADPLLRPLLQSLKPCHRNSKLVLLVLPRTLLQELNRPQASKVNDQGFLARWPPLLRRFLLASTSGDGNAELYRMKRLTLTQWRCRWLLDWSCYRWHVWRWINPGGAAASRQLSFISGPRNKLPEQQLGRSQLRQRCKDIHQVSG